MCSESFHAFEGSSESVMQFHDNHLKLFSVDTLSDIIAVVRLAVVSLFHISQPDAVYLAGGACARGTSGEPPWFIGSVHSLMFG